ncbi:MAG: hypothetical protein IAI49_16850, partial [Candidatus Eremiobacteraeota bacterium]|nr:hypothetical protein [Candidatus Eremiobacteraeota bacterium]
YLSVDWWEAGDELYVLSPAVVGGNPGGMFSFDPRGQCVFFSNGRCEIHEAKPFECRAYTHTNDYDGVQSRHRYIANEWADHQDEVKALCDDAYVPENESGILGLLGLLS